MGSGTGVATHPVAQLTEQVIPTCSLTQHPHRSHHPRAHSFHTIYDSLGRLQRNAVWWIPPSESSWVEHSYTRYEYPTNGVQSKVYSTVVDANANNGPDSNDEVLSESWFDGAGRVRISRVPHTFSSGSPVTWAATLTEYDILGRVKRQSVPTEVNSSFTATGDDSQFLWNQQEYDWMGRTTRTIPSDSNGSDGKDTLISYSACGCAGGLETTVQGPVVPRTDTTGDARRMQKSWEDNLGRVKRTQTFNWNETPYLTTEVKFNGRDQVIQTDQTDEVESVTQTSTATFDGHGRLASSHVPQQSTNVNTAYSYFPDGSLHVKTDGRGATNTMTYDSRGLVTNVANTWSGAPSIPTRKNFAMLTNGSKPTASSTFTGGPGIYPINAAFNGDRTGQYWGSDHGGWNDNTNGSFSDWLQVEFPGGEKTIDEIVVATLQDNYATAGEPDETTSATTAGNLDFHVEYWDGTAWTLVPGTSVTGNTKAVRKFTITPITTEKLRVVVSYSRYGSWRFSRIVEFEAWGNNDAPPIDTSVTYTYDNLGNRLGMSDSSGSTAYNYDSLSRLIGEIRTFNDLLPEAPGTSPNSFELAYTYDLNGSLKTLTDPYGESFTYGSDKAGRLTSVTGSTYAGVTEYAENAQYRAWGGLKSLEYGNGVISSTSYNSRLLPNEFLLEKSSTKIMEKEYSYSADGRLSFLDDKVNNIFDRLNIYDHLGRVVNGKSGLEAHGTPVTDEEVQATSLPYRQSYSYNAFSNMTERNNRHWGKEGWGGQNFNLEYEYENNRVTNANWVYDPDGRVLTSSYPDDSASSVYESRGLLSRITTQFEGGGIQEVGRYYDGDGREVKRTKNGFVDESYTMTNWPYGTWTEAEPKYFIRSSILGGAVISEANGKGAKQKTNVMAAGAKIATQSQYVYNNATQEAVVYETFDPSGMSYRSTSKLGYETAGDGQFDGGPAEMDPMGGNVGLATQYLEILPPLEPPTLDWGFIPMESDEPMYVNGQRLTCSLDGMAIGCASAMQRMESGSAIPAALAAYQHLPGFSFEHRGLGIYTWNIPSIWTVTDSDVTVDGAEDRSGGADGRPGIYYRPGSSGMFSTSWLAPLSRSQRILADNAVADLTKLIDNIVNDENGDLPSTCQSNVIDKLKTIGFDLDKFNSYLERGTSFYNGQESEAALIAVLSPGQFRRTTRFRATSSENASDQFTSVASYFSGIRGLNAITSGSLSTSNFTVFFRGDALQSANALRNRSLLFHEALHAYGAYLNGGNLGQYSDRSLLGLFGLNQNGPTSQITDYISENCPGEQLPVPK